MIKVFSSFFKGNKQIIDLSRSKNIRTRYRNYSLGLVIEINHSNWLSKFTKVVEVSNLVPKVRGGSVNKQKVALLF